jgi:capsular polysaccharide biosynthesis protein
MEFRDYWRVLWRRRQVILPLVAITFVASLIFNLVLPPTYSTSTTVQILALIPRVPAGAPQYYPPEYWNTVYSEYVSDDLGELVKSDLFATKVAEVVKSRYGQEIDVKDIVEAVSKTKRTHRTLKVTIATGSEVRTKRIAEAVDEVMRTDGASFFSSDDRRSVQINVLNPPRDPIAPGLVRRLMDVLLHTGVALVVGVALAFLLHYLDDRIQDEADAARTLGWPVLGAIPADGSARGAPTGGAAPVLAGLLPRGWARGWRKPATTP